MAASAAMTTEVIAVLVVFPAHFGDGEPGTTPPAVRPRPQSDRTAARAGGPLVAAFAAKTEVRRINRLFTAIAGK
jgi:hypothetical protein